MLSTPGVIRLAALAALLLIQAIPASLSGQAEAQPRPRSAARSNVGYIDNAIVGTQIQLRYDNARGADRPDLAEFIYAKCGCYGGDATGPMGILPSGAPVATTPLIEYDLDYHDIVLDGEYAFSERVSAFAEVPFRLARGKVIPNAEGIADISAGVKVAAIATADRYLTLQLRTYMPTGKSEDGLGTDHFSLEPAILYHEGSGDRLTAEAEVRLWVPLGGASNENTPITSTDHYYGNVFRYGAGLGYDVTPEAQVRFTPVVELVGWRILDGIGIWTPDGTPAKAQVTEAKGTNIVNVKIGARFGVRQSDAIFVGWGKALTDDHWYDNILRVEYRLTQ
jgi:hypothetical protein